MFTNTVDFNISKIAELHLVMVGVASTVELRREKSWIFLRMQEFVSVS